MKFSQNYKQAKDLFINLVLLCISQWLAKIYIPRWMIFIITHLFKGPGLR